MAEYSTHVDHTVTFLLASPGDVLPMTDRGWARLTGITVHLYEDRPARVYAGGQRCRKDGERDKRMGNVIVSVELPDPEVWIARAWEQAHRTAALRAEDLMQPEELKVACPGCPHSHLGGQCCRCDQPQHPWTGVSRG